MAVPISHIRIKVVHINVDSTPVRGSASSILQVVYDTNMRAALSPWTALEYCTDIQDLDDTWVCHSPESCGCAWNSTYDLLVLQPIGCKEMGSNARVALYAPSVLAPYVSLPSSIGGSTGYYSPTVISGTSTWISTAIAGCKLDRHARGMTEGC
jgi:hypothetical protein